MLLLVLWGSSEARDQAGVKAVISAEPAAGEFRGWHVTALQLIFSPRFASTRHVHPEFVLGYVLEGELRLPIEGEPEKVLQAGEVFYEAPGAIHLPLGSARAVKQARVLAFVFSAKGKELSTPL